MKINIYYGGRGVIDDPTIYVLDLIENVLSELSVDTKRYNIYEQKNSISTLASTVSGVDGIILATTVEWMGIGGYMTQFLDALWFYANKDVLSGIYMMPVVISTTYGERENLLALENAWEILGGLPCSGLCGYVEDIPIFTSDVEYRRVIEKKAENLYKSISQKSKGLPNSNKAVSKTVLRTQQLSLTPEESNQLSKYAADEKYVEKQKQDVSELSSMYRTMLGTAGDDGNKEFIREFKSHFKPSADLTASYQFEIDGRETPLYISVAGSNMDIKYESEENTDILAKLSADTLNEIVSGRMTFMRAFSEGEMTARGQFSVLRKLDEVFSFER